MTETTTKTVEKAVKAAASAIPEIAPTVIETVELVAEIPAKTLLTQRLVFVATGTVCALVGAGALYGAQKLKVRLQEKKAGAVDELE